MGKKREKKNAKPKVLQSRAKNDRATPNPAPALSSTAATDPSAITHLLRVEAINIGAIYDDTDDISIRRGGSLLVRQAVIDVEAWLGEHLAQDRVKPVSVGASIGTYGLKLDGHEPADIIQHIADRLNGHEDYRLACFALAMCPYHHDYNLVRENLLAQIRFQQLRQPSRYIPPRSLQPGGVCEFDHLSPGTKQKIKAEERYIGDSAKRRFKYGRTQRQQFYRDELASFVDAETMQLDALKFTDDLRELSHNPDFDNLSDKIALIYFDGNGFSAEQRDHAKTVAAQQNFDASVREKRQAFLADLIAHAVDDAHFKTDAGKIRLEVLMWGGDEFLLVVPAWKGWEVTQRFLTGHAPHFAFTSDRGGKRLLTHAGGLVFCGAKSPISRIRNLARELAELIKKRKENKTQNSFAYLVLESIEYPTNAIENYFKQRYGAMVTDSFLAADTFPLRASTLDRETLNPLLDAVPSRVLHALGAAAVRHEPDLEAYKQQMERTEQILGTDTLDKARRWLDHLFPNQKKVPHWQWLHLLELRDYLAPQPKPAAASKEVKP